MKTNSYLKIVSAIALGFFAFGTIASAADDAKEAKQITKEEAAKKYPPPNGKQYPFGDPNYNYSHKPGYIRSPYSTDVYDCSKVPKGALVLDQHVNKVFVKP
jgi:hypothetical protein